jgi:hypothetical protein
MLKMWYKAGNIVDSRTYWNCISCGCKNVYFITPQSHCDECKAYVPSIELIKCSKNFRAVFHFRFKEGKWGS